MTTPGNEPEVDRKLFKIGHLSSTFDELLVTFDHFMILDLTLAHFTHKKCIGIIINIRGKGAPFVTVSWRSFRSVSRLFITCFLCYLYERVQILVQLFELQILKEFSITCDMLHVTCLIKFADRTLVWRLTSKFA